MITDAEWRKAAEDFFTEVDKRDLLRATCRHPNSISLGPVSEPNGREYFKCYDCWKLFFKGKE